MWQGFDWAARPLMFRLLAHRISTCSLPALSQASRKHLYTIRSSKPSGRHLGQQHQQQRQRDKQPPIARGSSDDSMFQSNAAEVAGKTPDTTAVASPYVLTAALTAFSLIAWDVFGGSHLLVTGLDQPAHQWVSTSLSADTRQLAGGWLLSDSFIAAGVAGWWICGFTLIAQSGRKGAYLLGTAVLAYLLGGGFLLSGDVLLVDMIKHVFQRARPSALHSTFSFPSGHTTAGTSFPLKNSTDAQSKGNLIS